MIKECIFNGDAYRHVATSLIYFYLYRNNEYPPDIIWCREPFLEVMKNIEDMKDVED